MIVVESVGAGQDETDILYFADRIVLVLAPGMGDQIQALKAGQMEIGDYIVLNKGDRADSFLSEKELAEILSIPDVSRKHEFFKVSALEKSGISELTGRIMQDMQEEVSGSVLSVAREKEKLRQEVEMRLECIDSLIGEYAAQIVKGKMKPDDAIALIISGMKDR